MSNFTESELIPVALKIILDKSNGIATKDLIIELRNLMNPSGEDLEILSNRNDDKFSQKVRNIKSHKTLENKGYAKFYDDKFFITEKGIKFLNEVTSDNLDEKLLINIHEEIPISTKTSNSLRDQGVIFIEQLIGYTEKQLLSFPRMGKQGLNEIENILSDLGLRINSLENISNIFPDNTLDVKKKVTISLEKIKPEILEKISINILDDWPLSVRTINVCKKENIIFLGDLIFKHPEDLLKSKNFGQKSLNEINEFITRYGINIDELNIGHNEWKNLRDKLFFDLKYKQIDKEVSTREFAIDRNVWSNRSMFKDFNSFKKDFIQLNKIKISIDIQSTDLEKLIIEDVEYIISLFTQKFEKIFRARYGYREKFQTLGEIGAELSVTRERVRQLEAKLVRSFYKLGKLEKKNILDYFKQYQSLDFHKLFPNLNKNFYKNYSEWKNTKEDKFDNFMEMYCGVNKGFFNTTGRILKDFNFNILKEIFIFTPSGILIDNFIEIIKDNYGYDYFTSKSALEFMNNKEFIKIIDDKVYPIKINKNEEVAHILLNYPDGLHWKEICKIGNKSYTKNKWDLERNIGDSSLSMTSNPHIYLIDKGKHRLIKYLLLEVEDKDQIISFTIDLLNDLNFDQSDLEKIYKKIIGIEKYQNLNFYDFRAIIKLFGEEKGLYHSGISGQNTISFNKDIKSISLKDKIREIIENSNDEISANEINDKLQKSNEQLKLSTHLDALEDENIIFKINPGIYLNFKDAIRLCDQNEVEEYLGEILDQYEFITNAFIREKINENLGYGLSTSYYVSLIKFLAKKNNWFFGFNYLSKKQERKMPTDEYIKINYDNNLSNNENYDLISKNIGISRMYFNNIMYTKNIELDTDWVHQND